MGEDDLCRLCAESKSAADLLSTTDDYWTKQDLDTKISKFFQIKIASDDRLPKRVCSKCCEKVIITFEFNEKVQQAQETLRSVLSDEESGDYDCVTIAALETFDSSSKKDPNSQNDDLVECILSDNSQTRSSNAFSISYSIYSKWRG